MLGKEYLETARMLHRAALRMSDRAVASKLRALALNCEQRAEKAVQADAAKAAVREGLKSFSRARLQAARAAELAEGELEKIQDLAAPPQERAQRKRRLTKGPSEFREDRIDQPEGSSPITLASGDAIEAGSGTSSRELLADSVENDR